MSSLVKTSNSPLVNKIVSASSIQEIKTIVEDYIKPADKKSLQKGDVVIKLYNDATAELSNMYKSNIPKDKHLNIIAAGVYLNAKVVEYI